MSTMAEASMAAFGAAIGVMIAMAVVTLVCVAKDTLTLN